MTDNSDDIDWLVPFAIVMGLEILVSGTLVLAVTYSLIVLIASMAAALVWLASWMIRSVRAHEERPVAALSALLWANRTRLLAVLIGFELTALGTSAFSELKARIPTEVPFYADRWLADLDVAIFGQDAWRWFDSYLGAFAYPISVVYALWTPIYVIAFTALILSKPSQLKSQAIVAFGLMCLFLGVCLAYAFSSVGPIFYDRLLGGHRFADLLASVRPYFGVTETADYLWGRYASGNIAPGAGISAMPSIHVAGALWLALILRRAIPKLAAFGWAYVVLVYLGSVMLGWHYATDGLVGMAGLLLLWALSGQIIGWRQIPAVNKVLRHGFQRG